ncbi:type II secretion system F family protein [Paucidesulfovibrio longus]|uniref:type II secretion system F family protein n=1 Tax=Paucidesulfovibrio longus TaxID=889 RepID=UPI0003B37CCB|nr:type II secretion system F family protein [Paucidesulfovibrio longus]
MNGTETGNVLAHLTPELLAAVGGALVFLLALAAIVLVRRMSDRSGRAVRERLDALAMALPDAQPVDIVRRESMSEVPLLNRALERTRWARNVGELIRQGRAPGNPGMYILLSLLIGVCALYVSLVLSAGPLFLLLGLGAAFAPFAWLKRRKAKRMARFQEQLPDALDLVARAMKAGNTFSGGLRMVADEFEDPIGEEFRTTMDEINFGVAVEQAMLNLLARVDCDDLKFFVVSVNVQRETGGNLAEIIGGIAGLVRERFKLLGRVRVLSAEGRISAYILIALPFIVTGVLYLLNPEYMTTLFTTEVGKRLIQGALGSMLLGSLIIRRMIRIKV